MRDCDVTRLTNNLKKWKEICSQKFNNKFNYDLVGLCSKDEKITLICPIHGEFITTKALHQVSKTGCKKCSGTNTASNLRYEKFIAASKVKFPNVEILECDYVNNKSDVKTKCNVCNTISEWTVQGFSGSKVGCKNDCAKYLNNKRFFDKQEEETEAWKKRCSLKFNNKYDYSKVKACGVDDSIIIICPEHGEVETTRYNHETYATGCRFCSGTWQLTQEDFIKSCIELHGDVYNYSKTNYISDSKHVIVTCPEHGDFKTIPTNFKRVVNGKILGCPFCGMKKSYNNGTLYIFKIKGQDIWKVGISSSSLKSRYPKDYDIIDEDTIKLYSFLFMNIAYKAEKEIISSLADYKYSGEKILINDKDDTELFTIDPTEYANSIHSKYSQLEQEIDNSDAEQIFRNILTNLPEVNFTVISDEVYNLFEIENSNILVNFILKNSVNNSAKQVQEIYGSKYRVITLYEYTPILKNLNILRNLLGMNQNKIYARKCKVRAISHLESSNFLNLYHLQGSRISGIRLGLFHNDELVQVMTFGHYRYNKEKKAKEIHRLCTKSNLNVVGGASKLLKHFERMFPDDIIVTYADRNISKGNVYEQLGFKYIRTTPPGYNYVHESDLEIIHSREKFTKIKLKEYYENNLKNIHYFDENEPEYSIMKKNGYIRIETCGNLYFEKCLQQIK